MLPALILAGLMLGALGLLLSSLIRQLENFAGVMNFVIFPMFFASSALYPLWRMRGGQPAALRDLRANPFTHAVELIRFALYGQVGVDVAGGRRRASRRFPCRRHYRLQSVAGADGAESRAAEEMDDASTDEHPFACSRASCAA